MLHRLSNIDVENKTAICAKCGLTDIYIRKNGTTCCATGQRERTREYGEKHREQHRRWSREHYQRTKQQQKQERELLRERVLLAYGHECECCGETRKEFLAIHHTRGDGQKHRAEVGWGVNLHRWIERNNYPQDGLELSCHNCNMARGYYGYCPHEKERQRHY